MATNGITIALVITLCFHDSSSFISSNVVRRHEINDVYTFPSASRRKHARRSLWKMAVADETDLKRGSVKDDKALFGKSEDSALLKLDDGEGYMGDLTKMLKEPEDFRILGKSSANSEGEVNLMASGIILAVGAVAAAMSMSSITFEGLGISLSEILQNAKGIISDPSSALEYVSSTVQSMGPLGAVYFSLAYIIAEVLAIPAIPLTASAGYLFGVPEGTAIVLVSATVAAAIGFTLGRTFLRSYIEKLLDENPDFKRIDNAVSREGVGFKIVLLLRLAPIFPFALSNYLYGVSSVRFWPYLWGTLLGFTPGTLAYVSSGEIGKMLTLGSGLAQPWYIYAGGVAALSGVVKIATDVATEIL